MDIRNLFSKKNKTPVNNEVRYITVPLSRALTSITETTAMNLSTVYCAVKVISEAVATLSLELYSTDNEGYKTLINNSLQNILKKPSNLYSSFTFLQNMVSSMLLKGNAYAMINRDGKGDITSLTLLNNYSVIVEYVNNSLKYTVPELNKVLDSQDIIHVINYPTSDGLLGISTIQHARNSLELCHASEQFANNFFEKGGANSGYLKTSSAMTPQMLEDTKNAWQHNNSNINSNSVAILPVGVDYVSNSINPADAQFLESRKFQVEEIARWFTISPHKLFDYSSAHYSTLESTQLSFLTDTLQPILIKIQQELTRKLCKDNLVIEFNEADILKVDLKTKAEYYAKLLEKGVLSINEVRQELGYGKIDGGDKNHIQLNMSAVEDIDKIK